MLLASSLDCAVEVLLPGLGDMSFMLLPSLYWGGKPIPENFPFRGGLELDRNPAVDGVHNRSQFSVVGH